MKGWVPGHEVQAEPGCRFRYLVHGRGKIVQGLLHGRAHSGDGLDAGFEQFMLGLGVLGPPVLGEPGEDLRCPRTQLARVPVDQLQLPLDAQRGPDPWSYAAVPVRQVTDQSVERFRSPEIEKLTHLEKALEDPLAFMAEDSVARAAAPPTLHTTL